LRLQEFGNQYKSSYNYTPILAGLIEVCYKREITKLKELAESLDVSVPYAHYLVKKLVKEAFFKIWAIPHYDKLKLRALRCFLFVKSIAHRKLLLDVLSRHDFLVCTAPYYGSTGKGIWCDFLVPDGKGGDFVSFLESLLSYGIIDNYTIHPIIALKNIVMGFEWYNFSTNTWHFNWQSLLKDLFSKIDFYDGRAHFYEYEPEYSTLDVMFDFYDLYILHHLEQDVFTSISSLAPKLGTSPQNLSYHYRNHVLKNRLIRATRPYWYPFLFEESSFYIADIKFNSHRALDCFLASLHRKPIAYSYIPYRQATHPSVMLSGILPYDEVFNFMNFLDTLKDHGIVEDYNYYVLNKYWFSAKLLPYYRYNETLGWCFELETYLGEILKAAKKVQRSETKPTRATDNRTESM